jgi:hypothetical protein
MAQIEHLVPTTQLKTSLLAKLVKSSDHNLIASYDSLFDALFVRVVSRETETVVHYIDDHVGLLYQPDTLEIIGLQVEDFRHSFLSEGSHAPQVWRLSDAGIRPQDNADIILEIYYDDASQTFSPVDVMPEYPENRMQFVFQVNWRSHNPQTGLQGILRLVKIPSKS